MTPPVTGGSPNREGSKFYVLSSEPKEHISFCPDTRPGGPVTGATGGVAALRGCGATGSELSVALQGLNFQGV